MVDRQISCANCGKSFFTPTNKMFVLWRAKLDKIKQIGGLFDSSAEAINYSIDLPVDKELGLTIEPITMGDDKTKWSVWLTKLTKIEMCGGFRSHAEAYNKVIPNMQENHRKLIEKVYTIKQNFCPSCIKLTNSINKRIARDCRKRAVQFSKKNIKGTPVAPISEENYKRFMKFIVEKKIEEQQKEKEEEKEKESG